MADNIKHSKIKNTGILYELLTRQLTVDIMNGIKETKSVDLIKKYFGKTSELGKERELYQILTESKYSTQDRAEKLVEAVLKARHKLNNSSLRREKYNLIKEIKESYNVNDFFRGRIQNYRLLASIYKVFLTETTSLYNPQEEVDNKYTIIEHISSKKVSKKTKENKVIQEYQKQEKDLRLLSYQIIVDNFNKKYTNLNSMQKNLLKEYINNISNTNSLREFVDNEVLQIKEILNKYLPKIKDKVTKIKLKEAISQTKTLTEGKVVKDKQVISLMRYYSLIEELHNVCGK